VQKKKLALFGSGSSDEREIGVKGKKKVRGRKKRNGKRAGEAEVNLKKHIEIIGLHQKNLEVQNGKSAGPPPDEGGRLGRTKKGKIKKTGRKVETVLHTKWGLLLGQKELKQTWSRKSAPVTGGGGGGQG